MLALLSIAAIFGSAAGCGQEAIARYAGVRSAPSHPSTQTFGDSEGVLRDLLGADDVQRIDSARRGSIDSADELDCDFGGQCCWHNVQGASDDLDWGVVRSIDRERASRAFASLPPSPPFAAAAARHTHSLVYAFLVSCPVQCQRGPGQVSVSHWATPGALVDLCVLPLASRNFTFCQSLRRSSSPQTVAVPPQADPFVLVFVASEFTALEGGAVAIDSISYRADVCPGDGLRNDGVGLGGEGGNWRDYDELRGQVGPTEAQPLDFESGEEEEEFLDFREKDGPPPTPASVDFPYRDACQALDCNLNTQERRPVCGYECPDGVGCFIQRRQRTGNLAAGVLPVDPVQSYYLGSRLRPNSTSVLATRRFEVPEEVRVRVAVFEAAMDVELSSCLDDFGDGADCLELSPLGVKPQHRRWRSRTLAVPPGRHRLLFVGRNAGLNQASVGVSQPQLFTEQGRPIDCLEETVGPLPDEPTPLLSIR